MPPREHIFSSEPELLYLRHRVAELKYENEMLRSLSEHSALAISDNPVPNMVMRNLSPVIQLPLFCSAEAKVEDFMWHVLVKAGSPQNIQYGYYNSRADLLSAYDTIGILTALHERVIGAMAEAIREMQDKK